MKNEKINGITIYHVDKLIPDEKMEKIASHKVKSNQINLIIEEDSDVYTADGKLLLKFRKNVLPKNNIEIFYDNIISFSNTGTTNRSLASGNKGTKINNNNNLKIKTNIIGYFDIFSPMQKYLFKKGVKNSFRSTRVKIYSRLSRKV
jgi:hypothetical protein